MHLDVPTLVAMGSFVAACTGVKLLGAWWQNRNIPALALWGIADIIIAYPFLDAGFGFASRGLAASRQHPPGNRTGPDMEGRAES